MKKEYVNLSKWLSLILRHKPESIGLKLEKDGWVDVLELIEKMKKHNTHNHAITFDILEYIVNNDNKMRYSFNENRSKIRANQGHSTDVSVKFKKINPPKFLYHGTSIDKITSINKSGLKSMNRQYVHLSGDVKTAIKVGSRHGIPIILVIKAQEMHNDGIDIFISENNVYLTKKVETKYLTGYDEVE